MSGWLPPDHIGFNPIRSVLSAVSSCDPSGHATSRSRKWTAPRSSTSAPALRPERSATGSEPPGRGYFAILRLYSPTEAAIDKTWEPGDIVKVH
jgi:hypothetical protein